MRAVTTAAGFAALIRAACHVSGFAMLATVMNPGDTQIVWFTGVGAVLLRVDDTENLAATGD